MSILVVPVWAWCLLAGLMIVMISIDLIAHRGDHVDSRRAAIVWSVVWVVAAIGFGVFVTAQFGAEAGEQYFAAYLLEKSLSVDNLFLFLVIFTALGIPADEQRRVLTWGIIGALVTRGLFIGLGAAAIQRWHEVTYVFGAILVLTALKMLRDDGDKPSRLLPWLERHLPWTRERRGHAFVVREHGRWVATPLLLALIAIELADVVFAVDSIPAAFAVTLEPYLIYSANIFAVLGLRALFIVLVGAIADLRYLRYGLSAVLIFAGGKMLLASWVKVPPIVSVAVIAGMIGIAVAASLIVTRRERRGPPSLIDPG